MILVNEPATDAMHPWRLDRSGDVDEADGPQEHPQHTFEIHAKPIRKGGKVLRGYQRSMFADAWSRWAN
jgi:hypothetical protein